MDTTALSLGVGAIVATFTGPILALQIQRKLDHDRAARERKMAIFRSLMSLRMTALNPTYIQALNLIDIEFAGDNEKEKAVRTDWRVLLNNYFDITHAPDEEKMALPARNPELTTKLLMSMGKTLGYDFDEVQVKKGAYNPQAAADIEIEQHTLRRALLHLLGGDISLPVRLIETAQSDGSLPIPPIIAAPPINTPTLTPPPSNGPTPKLWTTPPSKRK